MSSQNKNLKPRTNKEKIKHLAILFFSLFLTLAVFSQIAAQATSDVALGWGNNLQPNTYNLTPTDWLYYKSSNDLTAYLGKKSSSLPTVRYQKGNDYLEFSMTGVSSSTAVSLETNIKTPNTPTLFYRNILDGADANYQITNIPFRVKEEIILKETFPTSLVGKRADLKFLFSAETSAKPVKQDSGSIAFFDDKGDYLFQLDKPFMYDAKGNRSEEVSIEIVSVGETKLSQKNNGFNFKFRNSNFESIFNDLIFKHLNIPSFIQNSKFKIQNFNTEYQIILKADNEWLNDLSRAYPVIIDPTVTHNADANFTGQMNRIADNDSTSSTQLESSYPEATKDPYTVLLLHFNEANGTTAGIRDYASTTRVITANGNASTTNYVTQLGMGNSAAFDGTSDYFEISDSDDWDFAASSTDTTISMWVYANDILYTRLIGQSNAGADGNWSLGISQSDNNGDIYLGTAGGPVLSSGNGAIIAGRWYNIAIAKRNGFTEMYKDGLLVASGSAAYFNAATTFLRIGARAAADGDFNGYIDNIRILKGRALTPEEIKAAASRRPYAVYTSSVLDATASVQWDTLNWTEGGVGTGDGETLYSANSLVAQWNFNETSGTTATSSTSGSCQTCAGTLTNFASTASQDQAAGTGWTANNKKWGAGSLMFDGVNDYVSVADNDGWNFAGGDFSTETWLKFNTLGSSQMIFDQDGTGNARMYLYYSITTGINFRFANSASTVDTNQGNTSGWSTGVWYHIAVVRNGSNINVYRNGISIANNTISISGDDMAATLQIGRNSLDTDYFSGILDSTRIYKGRALSQAEILSNYNAGNIEIQTRTGATSDPNDGSWEAWKPTTGETQLLSMDSDAGNWNAPQQIDGYTKLLLHMDGTDTATTFPNSATTTHTITANGNAQVDTAQSKFSGGSALFDGTGDYLSVPDNADWALGGTFTVDAWVRFNTIVNNVWIVGQGDGVVGENFWTFYYGVTTLNFLVVQTSSTIISISNSWTPVVNRWYHVAVVDNGGTWKLFVDGVQLGTDGSDLDTVHDISSSMFVGADVPSAAHFNGWIDELRISKGIARWTSNFTPPPRAYGSNVKADNETTLKQEGTGSAKLTLGAPQIDGNTVALWHFEETGTTTGTYLYDETANNNDATTTGTTVVDGIFGKARKFNGTSDYVSAPDSANWSFGTGDFTIDFWLKTSFGGATTQVLAAHGNEIAWSNTGWQINNINAGSVVQCKYSNNGGTGFELDGTKGVRDGVWHHVACVREGNSFKLYLDGKQDVSTTQSITILDSASIVTIGTQDDFAKKLNGIIDELRILKGRALSADEIAESYRMGANHHLTRQVSATDLSSANKLAFNVAADRQGTYLETMLGESDYANYELASSTLALSTTTVLYIKGDEIASSTSIKDSSFSGKAITANGNARTSGGGKIGNSVYFDGTGDWLTTPSSSDFSFGSGDFAIDMWVYPTSNPNAITGVMGLGASGSDSLIYTKHSASSGNMQASMRDTGGVTYIYTTTPISLNVWQHIALVRNGNNLNFYLNSNLIGSADVTGKTMAASTNVLAIGNDEATGAWPFFGYIDESRVIKGSTLTPDQIRQAYEYGLRSHQITIDFGATLQTSDLISNSTDYNFNITATTSGLSATTSGLYLGDKIIIKENLGGTEYTAQGTVNAINTTTGAITVPSWDTGSTFPASNGYSPNATVFKWQREYFDLGGAATTTRNAITNLTLRPTNGAEGRTVYLDDFRYNTNYLTASSSSAITSSNNRYLQYRAVFSSWDSFVSPYLSAINTLYTSLATMFPPVIGVSGGGFLSF